jgi:hypothetical protein
MQTTLCLGVTGGIGSGKSTVCRQLRGMGAGFLPLPIAQPYLNSGQLVACEVLRPQRSGRMAYAWRDNLSNAKGPVGNKALQWWLSQLSHPYTRQALLGEAMGFQAITKV